MPIRSLLALFDGFYEAGQAFDVDVPFDRGDVTPCGSLKLAGCRDPTIYFPWPRRRDQWSRGVEESCKPVELGSFRERLSNAKLPGISIGILW